MKVTLKKVNLKDLAELREIAMLTFEETFAPDNTTEDMVKYLQDGFSTEKLKAELMDSNAQFYFASHHEKAIGYLKINTGESQTEIKDKNALEIERIYVLKEFQGKKIGQLLYDKAMEIAKAKKVEYIWLGVWEKNPRAIRFYEKNGFAEFGQHLFQLGSDLQTDLMMKLNLK
ncbi:MAG: GNAT family N-acetyltransferase [Bacteroidota bacterium]